MNSKKRVILIGETGDGKTTLFNRLTGANEKTARGGTTVTRELVCGYSLYDTNFEVIDVPDLKSIENGILQIAGQMAGLQIGDLNQIILVIRHESHHEMRKQIDKYIMLVEKYYEKITIYVSFFDCCDQKNQQREKQEISDCILKDLRIKSIIFNKKNINNQSIVEQIFNIIQSSNSFNVEISENELLNWNYNVHNFENCRLEQKISMISLKTDKIFQQSILRIQESFNKLKLDNPRYQDFLQCLREFVIKKAQTFFDCFAIRLRFDEQFQQEKYLYLLYIHLLKEQNFCLNKIFDIIYEKEIAHPQSYLKIVKKCPYCDNLVWNKQNSSKVQCELGCKTNILWEESTIMKLFLYKTAIPLTKKEIKKLQGKNNLLGLLENEYIIPSNIIQQINDDLKELPKLVQKIIANKKIIPKIQK